MINLSSAKDQIYKMTILLTELLKRVPDKVEKKVRTTLDQNRSALQAALREECRLSLRTPEETKERRSGAQVPVDIALGYPDVLSGIPIEFPGEIEIFKILSGYRKALKESKEGVGELRELLRVLSARRDSARWTSVSTSDLESTYGWVQFLLETLEMSDPLGKVLGVREDVLGVYKFVVRGVPEDDRAVNPARILLYWSVIGLVSEWMDCTVEDLTIVVLTHELAHAYTQLGADIQGRRWPAANFSWVEMAVKEGLAQYYTHRVLTRLSARYPGALATYKQLLSKQPAPYQVHLEWVEKFTPEAVRRAMLEARRCDEKTLLQFNRRLEEAHMQRI